MRPCLVVRKTIEHLQSQERKASFRRHICVVEAVRHSAMCWKDEIQGPGVLCAAAQLRFEDKWCLGYFTQNYAALAANQLTGHMYYCFCAGRDEKTVLSVPLGLVFPSSLRLAHQHMRTNLTEHLQLPQRRKAIFLACSLFHRVGFLQEFEKMPNSKISWKPIFRQANSAAPQSVRVSICCRD